MTNIFDITGLPRLPSVEALFATAASVQPFIVRAPETPLVVMMRSAAKIGCRIMQPTASARAVAATIVKRAAL